MTTTGGKTIETDLIIKAVGVRSLQESPLLTSVAGKVNERQMLKVDEFLRVEGTTNVFALGDCAATKDAKTVMAASNSHAPAVAKSILAIENGKPPVKPSPPPPAMLVPIGPTDGGGYYGGSSFPTFLAVAFKSKDLFISKQWSELGGTVPV